MPKKTEIIRFPFSEPPRLCASYVCTAVKTKMLLITFLILLSAGTFTSCVPVKEYQKMYLNDKEMELSARKLEFYETNFQSYREGAAGANGGKVGGGCGCN